MKQEYNQPLMDDDGKVIFELFLLVSNIRKNVKILDFWSYEEKKTHNMFSLMLDPRFKGLCLVTSYVGRE